MEEKIEANPDYWKKCSSCKEVIAYKRLYWVCNVSTCNRKRTGLVFCKVSCWDAHVPDMNHRESWAEERRAHTIEDWKKALLGIDEQKPRKAPALPTEVKPLSTSPKTIIRRKSTP